MKQTKTELKRKAEAQELGTPYIRRVYEYVDTCPYCDHKLNMDFVAKSEWGQVKYYCACGDWLKVIAQYQSTTSTVPITEEVWQYQAKLKVGM